jgi:N-acetylmuramoyl-L-alanine amidase
MKNLLVLIAQAHGSNTPGKRSPDGVFREYAYSRQITKLIVEKLYKNGIKSIVVNPEVEEVKLSEQAARVNRLVTQYKKYYDDVILISPHVNAGPKNEWSKANGWTVFVYNKASQKSRRLARTMADLAYDKYGLKGDRWIPESRYFEANYAILRETNCPAILSENMFQTNKEDVAWLQSKEGLETISDLHVFSILEYMKTI